MNFEQYPDPDQQINIIAHSMGGLDSRYMITHLDMTDRKSLQSLRETSPSWADTLSGTEG